MSNKSLFQLVLIFAVLFVVSNAAYQVDEARQVIITQFGEPVGPPIAEPGLHFKLPFIQRTNFFEKRFLAWDGNPNQVPTKDKRFIWVDTYARWRIVDPLKFFQRLRDERGAQSRLDDILDGETRNAVARYDLIEIVRSTNRNKEDVPIEAEEEAVILEPIQRGRQKIALEILKSSAERTGDLGIEILDLRFKRISYVEEVQKDVFARMIAERQRIAELFRSEGEGEFSLRLIERHKNFVVRPTLKRHQSTPKHMVEMQTFMRLHVRLRRMRRHWIQALFLSLEPIVSC